MEVLVKGGIGKREICIKEEYNNGNAPLPIAQWGGSPWVFKRASLSASDLQREERTELQNNRVLDSEPPAVSQSQELHSQQKRSNSHQPQATDGIVVIVELRYRKIG